MGTEWNPLDNLVSLEMFEELFSYFFLQTMMYQIIRNENLDHDTVVTVLEGIYKDILISTDDNSSLQNKSLSRDFAVYLFYLQKRKRYQDEIDVFKILIEQMENPEYSSHVAPEIPGSIHEGGELGYSLAHAYGSVLDNPDLITCCVVGDGEAETG